MARSQYVYVVQNDEGMPYAAFTVKRELVSYLKQVGIEDVCGVVRIRDGREDAVALNLEELVRE